jgi:hypothetical protein
MTVRTTSRTVTFVHPFNLSGTNEVQPAGTYTVETDEELLQALSTPAYRRIAILLRLERTTGTVLTQVVETNPVELAGALARDAQPDETAPQQAYSNAVVSRKRARGRIESFREGWEHWVALNATDLTWTALVIGGVLFTSCLMRGWWPNVMRSPPLAVVNQVARTPSTTAGRPRPDKGEENGRGDGAIEKSAMRKVYMRLLPFAILSYFLAYNRPDQCELRRADDARRSRHLGHCLRVRPWRWSTIFVAGRPWWDGPPLGPHDAGGTIADVWFDDATGAWNVQQLNGGDPGLTFAPPAAGDPFVSVFGNQQHVVYRGFDGALWDVWFDGGDNSWKTQVIAGGLGSVTPGPQAASDPFVSVFGQQQHASRSPSTFTSARSRSAIWSG